MGKNDAEQQFKVKILHLREAPWKPCILHLFTFLESNENYSFVNIFFSRLVEEDLDGDNDIDSVGYQTYFISLETVIW